MFGNSSEQLTDLDLAYKEFIQTAQELSLEDFVKPLGDWTPRDIMAHFIGWK